MAKIKHKENKQTNNDRYNTTQETKAGATRNNPS